MGQPNVLRKVKIEGRWKMLPVARVDGRLDWRKVMVGGRAQFAETGTYYLEYREHGKKRRRAVGEHMADAKAALATQASVLKLRAEGVVASDAPQLVARVEPEGKSIASVVSAFETAPPLKFAKKSVAKYRAALREFAAWAGKRQITHVVQVRREDLLAYLTDEVRVRGRNVSTAIDKAVIVLAVMRDNGSSVVMRRGDWPPVVEQEPEVYEPSAVRELFRHADEAELVLYQTFLLSGFRDQEVGFLTWPDFDAKHMTLRVRQKPEMGFRPKTYQERTVPVPHALGELLQKHRLRQDASDRLIFATTPLTKQGQPGGQRDDKMLSKLKTLAKRAGLNCGLCQARWHNKAVTCATHPVCKGWGLHKFRHTYATTLLRDGVDIVTVQKLLGHKDINSTLKYLRALSAKELTAKINESSLVRLFL